MQRHDSLNEAGQKRKHDKWTHNHEFPQQVLRRQRGAQIRCQSRIGRAQTAINARVRSGKLHKPDSVGDWRHEVEQPDQKFVLLQAQTGPEGSGRQCGPPIKLTARAELLFRPVYLNRPGPKSADRNLDRGYNLEHGPGVHALHQKFEVQIRPKRHRRNYVPSLWSASIPESPLSLDGRSQSLGNHPSILENWVNHQLLPL